MHDWAARLPPTTGVAIHYNVDGRLIRRHQQHTCARQNQQQNQVSAIVYANDTALTASTWMDTKAQWQAYTSAMRAWGMTTNVGKAKILTIGSDDADGQELTDGDPSQPVERVRSQRAARTSQHD